MRLKLIAAAVGVCLLAACSSATPVSVPTANQPLIVTSGGPEATATSPVSIPTTPEPTSTTAPTMAAPTAVIVTPATVTQFGPTNFPDDVDPLTGLQVADPALLNRRPLAIKVSEFPRRVRPQDGLSFADLVFEHYAEAGVSRMTAIFLGNDSPKVGSIRSARLIDLVLTESYQAMLVTSGSSQGVLGALSKAPFFNRLIAEATGFNKCPPLCREGTEASTNNLFASTADLWKTTDGLGLNGRQDLHGMAFFPTPPAGGQAATTVHIDFQANENTTEWRYDSASARYARWVDTDVVGQLAPHIDAVTGQQLSAANVVVLYANHVTSVIPEDFGNGGHCGYEIQLWNSGPAKIFRDGQEYDLTWVRFKSADEIGFVGPDNQIFPFKPGNSWFEVINFGSPTTFENGAFSARFKGPSQQQGCPIS
jgi:Protein of unknown function (DUF3048) N-terminal domain/Protein of unknown function (DUF3048) C-terminal domain